MRRIVVLVLIFALLCGCVPADEPLPSTSFFAMNTPMSVQIDGGETLLRGVEELAYVLEHKLSVTDEKSEIFAINSNGGGEVSSETAGLIEFALDMCESTDGALDITIYPVLRAWGFTVDDVDYDNGFVLPTDGELSELLALVDYKKVEVSDNSVTLGEGMMLDLGAVAKGYASDRIAGYLRRGGVTSALLNLGGNVYALGKKPNGVKWTIGVKSPERGIIGTLQAEDAAVVTSGGYERYFERDGVRYHHIIDPSTGRPADSGLASVTVVGSSGARCDALSTALFVMGLDRASDYWREHGDFEAVFVTSDGELLVTAGLEDNFVTQGDYGGTLPSVIR